MRKALEWINQTLRVCFYEFRSVLNDPGVMTLIVGAMIAYPILYCSIYQKETLYDIPIAAVDDCRGPESREFLRRLDASPYAKVVTHAVNMAQAQDLFDAREIRGIVYIPADFNRKLTQKEQAFVSTYCDMSSFLYYRAMVMASNYASMDMNREIQVERLGTAGVVGANAEGNATPIPSQETILFNPNAGFFSFLMQPVLILIIHQTLVFGICMMAGQAREDGRFRKLLPLNSSTGRVVQVVIGKALCYLAFYSVLTAYVLGVIPRLFGLPHLGDPWVLLRFMFPFLLAFIFLALTLSSFMRKREMGLVTLLFSSMILLFLSGFSWPQSNIGGFWRAFGMILPSTHGMQGYIKINGMGASLGQVSAEYMALWVQAAVYFTTACLALKPHRVKGL